jgi:hypothetical protein
MKKFIANILLNSIFIGTICFFIIINFKPKGIIGKTIHPEVSCDCEALQPCINPDCNDLTDLPEIIFNMQSYVHKEKWSYLEARSCCGWTHYFDYQDMKGEWHNSVLLKTRMKWKEIEPYFKNALN